MIFSDTPGVVTPKEVEKFKLGQELVTSPERTCQDYQTDLILVVHDVSTRFTREAIHKNIQSLLLKHSNVPAVLVLNKIGEYQK